MNLKKVLAAALAGCMLLAMSGCGTVAETASKVTETASSVASAVGNEIRAGGRDHNKSYTAKDNEVLANTFFEYSINSAELYSSLEDYVPNDKNHAFLVIDVTVKNVFEGEASIPMSLADFELGWAAVGESTTLPEANFGVEGQLPDEWTQFKGDTKTGKLIYVIPNNIDEFELIYNELYEDDFEGSKYSISFKADRSTFVELTEEELAMIG